MRRRADAITILYLGANPFEDINTNEELDRIRKALPRTVFDVRHERAIAGRLHSQLREHRPRIVHFGLHGAGVDRVRTAHARDFPAKTEEPGLVLFDEQGGTTTVSADRLVRTFRMFRSDVQCVVLNACFSEGLANALAQVMDHVVGMSRAIMDPAAIHFSETFYQSLAEGESFNTAFVGACSALDDQQFDVPKLLHRPGVDAEAKLKPSSLGNELWTAPLALAASLALVALLGWHFTRNMRSVDSPVQTPLSPPALDAGSLPRPLKTSTTDPPPAVAVTAGTGPTAALKARSTKPRMDPWKAVRPMVPVCTPGPQVRQRSGKWYLTCACENLQVKTPDDLIVDHVESAPDERVRRAVMQAVFQQWQCP